MSERLLGIETAIGWLRGQILYSVVDFSSSDPHERLNPDEASSFTNFEPV